MNFSIANQKITATTWPTPRKTTRNSHVFLGGGFKCWQLSQQPCPMTEWNLPTFQADFLVPIKPDKASHSLLGNCLCHQAIRNTTLVLAGSGLRKNASDGISIELHPQRAVKMSLFLLMWNSSITTSQKGLLWTWGHEAEVGWLWWGTKSSTEKWFPLGVPFF